VVIGGGGYIVVEGVKSIVNSWAGEEPGNDEGEGELKKKKQSENNAGTQLRRPDRKSNGEAKGRLEATKGRGSTLIMTKACIRTWGRTRTGHTTTTRVRAESIASTQTVG
jgi:hypothetical protein